MNIFNIFINDAPTEWEHGWKTDVVIATRYSNPFMGFNIGFKFPKHVYECDRSELMDFIRDNGGHVYQCGGYPGAEVLATFDGVNDKETANIKLKEIVPLLHKFMKKL